MESKYTLVIVDVQTDFEATKPSWLRLAVMDEIVQARTHGFSIIMLEFFTAEPPRTFGDTYHDLVAAASKDNLANFTMRAKAISDGSERVKDACEKKGFRTDRFRVCGVNTHGCIDATVSGLHVLYPDSRIEVVTSACNDWRGNNWDKFPEFANLSLV